MHWTEEIAKDQFVNYGKRYTLFRRSGHRYESFNDLSKFFDSLQLLYENVTLDKVRTALRPDNETKFYVMEYPEDETFWVKGILIDGSKL